MKIRTTSDLNLSPVLNAAGNTVVSTDDDDDDDDDDAMRAAVSNFISATPTSQKDSRACLIM